jgi:tetratricopeptide (TPR) repeat protein
MCKLAQTNKELNRYQDALVLYDNALEILRRQLPEDHPQIGTSNSKYPSFASCLLRVVIRYPAAEMMHQLADTYKKLGRNHDAAVLEKKVLEFLQRLHPENHAAICMHGHNFFNRIVQSLTGFDAGRAMDCLACTLGHCKQYEDAIKLLEKAIEIRRVQSFGIEQHHLGAIFRENFFAC